MSIHGKGSLVQCGCRLPGSILPQLLLPLLGPVEMALSLQAAVAKHAQACDKSPALLGGGTFVIVSDRKQLACLHLSCVCG